MNLEIRPATRDDIPGMMHVRANVRENRLVSRVIAAADYIAEMAAGRGWVAVVEGRVVAFAIGNARTGNIWALFALPDFEGHGIGRRLHDAMVEWLWSTGLTQLQLGTAPGTRAQRFYERAGWQAAGVDAHGDANYVLRRADHSARA